jgi:hypothetical protein
VSEEELRHHLGLYQTTGKVCLHSMLPLSRCSSNIRVRCR